MANDTVAWRNALQAKGRDWVLAELRTRPGQPQDILYDVVHEPPFPTREFCQRWCVEDDNKILRVAGSTKAAIIAVPFLLLFRSPPSRRAVRRHGPPIERSRDLPAARRLRPMSCHGAAAGGAEARLGAPMGARCPGASSVAPGGRALGG